MLEYPPELADGGFWHHVAIVEETRRGNLWRWADLPDGMEFAATDLGATMVVRSVDLMAGVTQVSMSAGVALTAAGETVRLHSRLRGR